MTDQTITAEQRAAWLRVEQSQPKTAELLAPLLPSGLTASPSLPPEPGHYEDEEGRHWLHQVYVGDGDHPDVDQWLDWRGVTTTPPGPVYRLERARGPLHRRSIVEAVLAGVRASDSPGSVTFNDAVYASLVEAGVA